MNIQKKNENKIRIIRNLEPYLLHGTYQFDDEFRFLCKTSKKNNPIVKDKRINNEYIEIKKENSKIFQGDILWFCINGDIKIFSDFETLTLCNNKNNYIAKIENHKYFSKYFDLPKLKTSDDKTYQLIEEFIHFRKIIQSDTTFILKTIYKDYIRYFKIMKEKPCLDFRSLNNLIESNKNPINNTQFEQVCNYINAELFNKKFPYIKLHGDLWTGNILLTDTCNNTSLKYIDWDESGTYIFFYDFFKFMWNEFDVNDRYDYYQRYMNNEFDQYLDDIFSIFKVEFNSLLKRDYFCMFILNYMLDYSSNIPYLVKQEEIYNFQKKILCSNFIKT